jgi:hypothetical protein
MAGTVVIRPVGEDERAAWEPLWNGYLAFYKATLAPGASDVAWQRFHDPDEPMFLLGAYVGRRQFRLHAVPQDFLTRPSFRGGAKRRTRNPEVIEARFRVRASRAPE